MTFKILCVFGTRPEAIKMAPIIKRLQVEQKIQTKICITGQHRKMLDSVLESFEIVPDFDLEVMTEKQDLSSLTAKILTKLAIVYTEFKPNLVLVHGDTTTTLAASLSAYYHHIPVAHVEAGLRTGDINAPWPEEVNRKLTGALSAIHFAPTALAKRNLLHEGISEKLIHITGNTVIDSLHEMVNKLEESTALNDQLKKQFHYLNQDRKMILVTGHRRENFGEGFEQICKALINIATLFPDVDIVYPVHLNPCVRLPVRTLLGEINNIHLIDPVDYLPFIYLMKSAYLILTDSGGIQEEAPSLGKPVLVMRDITERPEAVDAGTVQLVGTNLKKIVSHVKELFLNNQRYQQMSKAQNPYGDGKASARIVSIILQLVNQTENELDLNANDSGIKNNEIKFMDEVLA